MGETFESLDAETTHELRRRAFRTALRHADLGFLWRVIEMIPAADEVAGKPDRHIGEVQAVLSWLEEYLRPDQAIEEAMRPVFIDYLLERGGSTSG